MVGVSTLVPSVAALGALADRAEPGERERRVAAVVAPRLEVVGDPAPVSRPSLLGVHRVVEQRRGPNCSAEAL